MAPRRRWHQGALTVLVLLMGSSLLSPGLGDRAVGANGRPSGSNSPTGQLAAHDLGNFLPEARNRSGRMVGVIVLPSGERHAAVMDPRRPPVDLGTGSQTESSAHAVNADGVVVGSTWDNVRRRALPFRWTPRTGLVELPLPGLVVRYGASASDINDRGDILIHAQLSNEGQYVWRSRSRTYEPLDSPAGFVQPSAINNRGVVVGSFSDVTSQRVVYWDGRPGRQMHEVDPQSQTPAYALDVNNRGVAVGEAGDVSFSWDLATSRRRPLALDRVRAINDRGVIAGSNVAYDSEGDPVQQSAFLWDSRRQAFVELRGTPGRSNCYATGLSPDGVAVGACAAGAFLDGRQGVYWDAYRG